VSSALRVEIFPGDLAVSVGFYVDVLAFDVARNERDASPPYAALRRDDVRLGLSARPPIADPEQRRPPAGVELVLEVDDLRAERRRVAAAEWPVTEDVTLRPWGLRDFRLLDPDGYYWRLTTRT